MLTLGSTEEAAAAAIPKFDGVVRLFYIKTNGLFAAAAVFPKNGKDTVLEVDGVVALVVPALPPVGAAFPHQALEADGIVAFTALPPVEAAFLKDDGNEKDHALEADGVMAFTALAFECKPRRRREVWLTSSPMVRVQSGLYTYVGSTSSEMSFYLCISSS